MSYAPLEESAGEAGCQVVGLSTSGTVPRIGSSHRNPRSHRTRSHEKLDSLGRLDSLGSRHNGNPTPSAARRYRCFPYRRDGTWRD